MDSDFKSQILDNAWLILPIVLVFILILYFLFPLLDGIVLGVVFAYVGRPIKNLSKKRRRIGALVATICIILPITLIITLGTVEIISQLNWVVQHQSEILRRASIFVGEIEIPPAIYDELTGSLQNVMEIIARVVTSVPVFSYGMSMALMALNFLASVFVCYFLLLDGNRLAACCTTILPATKVAAYRRYCNRVDSILSGIFIGSIYTAILGGVISIIVFCAFDVPKPFALASIVFVSGMVPVLTAWLVIVPITVYRYFSLGILDASIFFIVSSLLIYLPSELIIRPYLVSAKSTIHPLLVMLSFVGGALVAGIGGFFLAPALMGILVGAYQVHKEERDGKKMIKNPD